MVIKRGGKQHALFCFRLQASFENIPNTLSLHVFFLFFIEVVVNVLLNACGACVSVRSWECAATGCFGVFPHPFIMTNRDAYVSLPLRPFCCRLPRLFDLLQERFRRSSGVSRSCFISILTITTCQVCTSAYVAYVHHNAAIHPSIRLCDKGLSDIVYGVALCFSRNLFSSC